MAVNIIQLSADAFREFRRANRFVRYDEAERLAWFTDRAGKVSCTDRASYWNNTAGSPDVVAIVVADTVEEAGSVLSGACCADSAP